MLRRMLYTAQTFCTGPVKLSSQLMVSGCSVELTLCLREALADKERERNHSVHVG